MKEPNKEIRDYIASQRVGVLAVEMLDGSPHAATVHLAHSENPLQFFFETSREYRKCEALFGRESTRASLVIGSDEGNLKTLQLDGVVRLLNKEVSERERFSKVYLEKFPNKKEKIRTDPKVVLFTFLPSWWRFTDWTRPEGKLIVSSEDS